MGLYGGPGRRWRRKPWVAPGDGADHFTGLPLELRARIASFLPFPQVGQLALLSRPWRRIHDHTRVVQLELDKAHASLEAALLRRAEEGTGSSKVDVLRISYCPDDPRTARRADRIINLADAHQICIKIPRTDSFFVVDAWALDLPPSARDLEVGAVVGPSIPAPTISGPGAAALQNLRLEKVVLSDWPCPPSLRSMTLDSVRIEAPFPPGAWCPLLEDLCIADSWVVPPSEIEPIRMDIRLPLLKRLKLNIYGLEQLRDFTVVAPELELLDVIKGNSDYRSFTLRAPQLRCLRWFDQFTERVDIEVGKQGSVREGMIEFTCHGGYGGRLDLTDRHALMMRMVKELLSELSPEQLTDKLRPYITLDDYTTERGVRGEKLTCDLDALMSSLEV